MRCGTAIVLAFGIIASLLAAEIGSRLIYVTPMKRQAHDGIHDLVNTFNILAVSSSHGRSFHVLGNKLAQKTNGELRLVAVPLEAGKVHEMGENSSI